MNQERTTLVTSQHQFHMRCWTTLRELRLFNPKSPNHNRSTPRFKCQRTVVCPAAKEHIEGYA